MEEEKTFSNFLKDFFAEASPEPSPESSPAAQPSPSVPAPSPTVPAPSPAGVSALSFLQAAAEKENEASDSEEWPDAFENPSMSGPIFLEEQILDLDDDDFPGNLNPQV